MLETLCVREYFICLFVNGIYIPLYPTSRLGVDNNQNKNTKYFLVFPSLTGFILPSLKNYIYRENVQTSLPVPKYKDRFTIPNDQYIEDFQGILKINKEQQE